MTRRLDRAQDSRPAAPVRIVHLGLGNFFRAHQAWYTERAPDAAEWGIAAFTGRSDAVADQLAPAEGLYTLVTQGPQGDRYDVIGSLSAVHAASDTAAWRGYFSSPELAIVTSTVTEAGYVRAAGGGLDTTDERVRADIAALTADPLAAAAQTAPGKFVAGLLTRRDQIPDAKLTFVPCDNVSGNGAMVARVVADLATAVDSSLPDWIDGHVTFVTTMVDRITPRATDADVDAVAADTGIDDPAAVVTEPFTEWVLQGEFANRRPQWDAVGARFVDDVDPFEMRKLWLLNGSHSLMAYAATIVGHQTVIDAINDPVVRQWVDQWWDVAARHLPLAPEEIQGYRDALIERYENPRVRHLLAQIAADGSQKLPIRIIPALKADLADGLDGEGALRAVAAWTLHLRGLGAPVNDTGAVQVQAMVSGELDEAVGNVLEWLGVSQDAAQATTVWLARDLEALG